MKSKPFPFFPPMIICVGRKEVEDEEEGWEYIQKRKGREVVKFQYFKVTRSMTAACCSFGA